MYENKAKEAIAFENPDGTYTVDLKVEAKKVYSDSLGVQTTAELADWLEIGVFGEDIKDEEFHENPEKQNMAFTQEKWKRVLKKANKKLQKEDFMNDSFWRRKAK